MKKTYAYLFAALALVLVGSGCFSADDRYESNMDDQNGAAVQVEAEPVYVNNNHHPRYNLTIDGARYKIATGPDAQVQAVSDNAEVRVNSQVLQILEADVQPAGLETDASIIMKFVASDNTDMDAVGATLSRAVTASEAMEVAGFDAYVYTHADGLVTYVWPTPEGYYAWLVLDEAARDIVNTLEF